MRVFIHPVPPDAKYRIFSLPDATGEDSLSAFFKEQCAQNALMRQKAYAITALLKRLASGLIRHDKEVLREIKLKKSDPGPKIFELKRNPLRVLFFYQPEGLIVCTNGCYKDSPKTPQECIAAAVSRRDAYLGGLSERSLEYVVVEVKQDG